MNIFPFKLEPDFRDYVWGGNRLRPNTERTAEAWAVYEENLISSGPFKGQRLKEVALVAGESLLGQAAVKKTGMKFPLLIKLLDSQKWLSLQVHPNNMQAVRWEGPGSYGKMEGWYIIDAEKGSALISGFKSGTTQADISDTIGKKAMLEIVSRKAVKKGDAILITPGTIHAIGPGLMVYEVQQTSDITYRVYDWDRPMNAGRKLHIKQALDVLDPHAGGEKVSAEGISNDDQPLLTSEFFKLRIHKNPTEPIVCYTHLQSFHALTMVDGEGSVGGDGWEHHLGRFETLLIPASVGKYSIFPGDLTCLDATTAE